MSLKVDRQINVDFQDSKYISINAKQYDRMSRFVLVTCYNNGVIFPLDSVSHRAYVRYRKADDLGVFNSCKITDGKILVELTEQMLSVVGKCYADLVILENNPVETEEEPIVENTGELIIKDNDSILSTMIFCINVIETAFDNTEIESSYEYNALNDLLIKATEDYSYVIKMCKISEENAKTSEENALKSEQNSSASEQNANVSEQNAKTSEQNAKTSEQNANVSEQNSLESEKKAKASEEISVTKATEASNSAMFAKSYAVGGTDSRENEDFDNAQYYYIHAKAVSDGIDGSFVPIGTIEFSELQSVTKDVGYVYHISDTFVTDDTFKCGAGVSYPSGTNVYYTSDGYWDCFVSKEITGDIHIEDDDDGNVVIEFVSNETTITYEDYNALAKTITQLQEKIAAFEAKDILEIS